MGGPGKGSDVMGSKGITIRRAQRGDAEAIATIHAASWRATYAGMVDAAALAGMTAASRRPMWERIPEREDGPFAVFVAEVDGAVVGFCSVGPSRTVDDAGELYTIYLEPGREGTGFGHALLTAAEGAIWERGHRVAILWVLWDNAVARRFYERHGWTADGTEQEETLFGVTMTEVRYAKSFTGD
jgi:L-amino acid N-acyltransferase YncA